MHFNLIDVKISFLIVAHIKIKLYLFSKAFTQINIAFQCDRCTVQYLVLRAVNLSHWKKCLIIVHCGKSDITSYKNFLGQFLSGILSIFK